MQRVLYTTHNHKHSWNYVCRISHQELHSSLMMLPCSYSALPWVQGHWLLSIHCPLCKTQPSGQKHPSTQIGSEQPASMFEQSGTHELPHSLYTMAPGQWTSVDTRGYFWNVWHDGNYRYCEPTKCDMVGITDFVNLQKYGDLIKRRDSFFTAIHQEVNWDIFISAPYIFSHFMIKTIKRSIQHAFWGGGCWNSPNWTRNYISANVSKKISKQITES